MILADFNQLISDWLRPKLRTPKRLDLYRNLISPLVTLYSTYAATGAATIQAMQYTCQTASMEAMLNDYMDNTLRRIWIENVVNEVPELYLYRDSDVEPATFLYRDADAHTPQLFIYRDADFTNQYDFIVHYPAALDQLQIQSFTMKYKKAGKRPGYLSF